MTTFKIKDRVTTPNGNGKIITLPIGFGSIYAVLHDNGRASTYDAKDLKPEETCHPDAYHPETPITTILPN